MKNGKYVQKKSVKSVALILVLVLTLLLGCTVGGTLAWLLDTTDPVVNTFTAGNVDITLKETPYEDGEYEDEKVEGQDNDYPAIPGATYRKDPTVEVVGGSEDCYLFVKFTYSTAADTYLNYTSTLTEDNNWTKIDKSEVNGETVEVWSRVVKKDAAAADRSFDLLAQLAGQDNGITLEIDSTAVTNQTMATAAAQKLEWQAYAVQFNYLKDEKGPIQGEDAAERAWNVLINSNPAIYPTPETP